MSKAIQMTTNPSLSESKTKPSKLKSKSPTTTESPAVVVSAIKPPTGCSKVYYFLLRVIHFFIENSFLLVALVALVPLPLDVAKELDFGNDKFPPVLREPVATGDTDDEGNPVFASHEILFGFVPKNLETRYHKVARCFLAPSIIRKRIYYTCVFQLFQIFFMQELANKRVFKG